MATPPKRSALDAIDRQLVRLLLKNGRASFKTLASQVGLTSPACAERVRRLQGDGIITGYRADVDWNRLGMPIHALIRIAAAAEYGKDLLQLFRQTPNVIEVMRVTGVDSYIVRILAESSEELETVIDRIGSHGTLTTSIVLSTPLAERERAADAIRQ